MYMVPLSIAIATSARVSFWLGAGDPNAGPRRASAPASAGPGHGRWCSPASCCWRAHGIAAHLRGRPRGGGARRRPAGVAGASTTWRDAMQALCVFVLRCYRVAVAPLVAYCVLLWGVGLGGGYLLAYRGIGAVAARSRARPPSGCASSFALALLAAHPAADSVAGRAAAIGRRRRPAARTRAGRAGRWRRSSPRPACSRSAARRHGAAPRA